MTVPWDKVREFVSLRKAWIGFFFVICIPVIRALWNSYISSTAQSDEMWSAIEHVFITVGLILLFQKLESDMEFRHMSAAYVKQMSDLLKEHEISLRDSLLPLSSKWGLVGAHSGIDFLKVFSDAERNSTIHIFFTFHPNLSNQFAKIIQFMYDKNIRVRLLIANPHCASIKERFVYLGWSQDLADGKSELTKLTLFTQSELPRFNAKYQSIEAGHMLEVKTFDHLPDLPIIIETTDPHRKHGAGEVRAESNTDRKARIRRALTGFYILQPAVDGVLLEWRNAGDDALASRFMDYFDRRWENGVDVDLSVQSKTTREPVT